MAAVAGTRLGRYEIRSLLGMGGMGEVYLAQDTQLDRPIALKILPTHLASDEQRMRRFVQEAKAASALNHPNIITIHEVGHVDSEHFIATEFIDGVTLRHLVRGTRMTLHEIFDIVTQVASALASAHEASIVHRDIKPENIMLRRDGYVKVLDFGLAKLMEKSSGRQASDPEAPTKSAINTSPGVVMGTVNYMSPEQARGLPVDARSDIWSFGVVLYEMITGHVPFGGATASDVIASILEREPPPLTRYSPAVPAELERIVSKTLAKDTEERYQTIKDLLIDLRRLKQRLAVDAELERFVQPDLSGEAAVIRSGDQSSAETPIESATGDTEKIDKPRPTSSTEYLVSEIKRHKRGAMLVLIMSIVVAAGIAYFSRNSQVAIDSVAVLPFVNVGTDPIMEDLSDGITENIINNLAQLPQLRVVPRSTVFNYKGQTIDPQKVGRDLGVRAVFMGRVLKRGDTLIVQTELVDILNNSQLWGEQYKHDQSDIMGGLSSLTLQEEISKQILDKLRLKLTDTGKN